MHHRPNNVSSLSPSSRKRSVNVRRPSRKVSSFRAVIVAILVLLLNSLLLTTYLAGDHRKAKHHGLSAWEIFTHSYGKSPSYLGLEYTNPTILSQNCSLTVLVLDPHLPNITSSPNIWYSLESVASNVPQNTTCFLLQTSSCIVSTTNEALAIIEQRAMPHFTSAIQRGNVRVTFLDHSKYHLSSCNYFYTPSNAWMMASYWDDEFTPYDSDLILSVQDDTILCHFLDPDAWRDLAYVGAPWPPRANLHNNHVPKEGMCKYVTMHWKRWSRNRNANLNVCERGRAPVGNGGLALRSRYWFKKAIMTCPHKDSGVINDIKAMRQRKACKVLDWTAEDTYFGTILPGIGAPMPNAFEASLFSAEMILPEKVLEYYGMPENVTREDVVAKRWSSGEDVSEDEEVTTGVELYRRMKQDTNRTIPIGFHKPWLYMDASILMSKQLEKECPYLKQILPKDVIQAATIKK